MSSYNLLNFSLTVHLVGLVLTAGSALMGYFIFKKFLKEYFIDKQRALAILDATAKFPALGALGMALLILSGIAMMILTHGVYMNALWFNLKLGIIALLIINGMVVARKLEKKMKLQLQSETEDQFGTSVRSTLTGLNISRIIQLVLLFQTIILASFRFS